MSSPRLRRSLLRALAVSLGVMVPLAAVELGYRAISKVPHRAAPANLFCGDCPVVFELNPEHANISRQKLRDREFTLAPPEGTYRIMVLGDSLPYGIHVQPAATFPKQLEKRLHGAFGKIEILNAGVTAYTPYNERHWWLARGRELHPHLVIVSFCMNDVVNPVLHWLSHTSGAFALDKLPEEAIPNPAYHRDHALPELRKKIAAQRSPPARLLRKSVFYKQVVSPLFESVPDSHAIIGGKRFPTYLTGEDTLGIQVLMDYESVEWRWLRDQYDKLIRSIRAGGADVMVLINPLAYQLAPDYPFLPQGLLARYCNESGIRCLDILPYLRDHGGEKLFYGKHNKIVDIWHYTAEGHAVVADALAAYLEQEKMLPARASR